MIEGTKPFRSRNDAAKNSESSTTKSEAPHPPATPASDAASKEDAAAASSDVRNPDRREWFRSLVPALGNGLVEILRASNNLKRDFQEIVKREE